MEKFKFPKKMKHSPEIVCNIIAQYTVDFLQIYVIWAWMLETLKINFILFSILIILKNDTKKYLLCIYNTHPFTG